MTQRGYQMPSDVFVLKGGAKWLVRPGTFVYRNREAPIIFRNLTTSRVRLLFPWPPSGSRGDVLILEPKGESGDMKPAAVPSLGPGVYSYSVYVEDADSFAEGESDPRIIVDS